jgi:hypothetical protein
VVSGGCTPSRRGRRRAQQPCPVGRLPWPLDYEGVRAAVRHWQPYAGLVYFHLLLANLEDRGVFADRPITDSAPDAITMAQASSGELSAEHV